MATVNKTNNEVKSITTLTTIPAPTSQTGTISCAAGSKDVTGVGTLFTSTLYKGDWIIDYTNFEARKIQSIGTNLALTLDYPFTNALAGVALVTAPSSRVIRVQLVSAAGGKLNNVTLPTNVSVEFDKSSRETQHSSIDYIDPLFVDGTGGAVFAVIQY